MNDQQSEQRPTEKENQSALAKANNLRKRFPIVFNIILMGITGLIIIWLLMIYIDSLTNHGQEQVVPDVKSQNIHVAAGNLEKEGFSVELADSVYDNVMQPGTVVEQNPHPGSKVKPGRTIYLTIVAYSPKMISVPDIDNTSLRQGESMLRGAGFKNIVIQRVPSEYQDLVMGATCNGKPVVTGQKLPANSIITLEVGEDTGDLEPDNETGLFDE